MADDATCIIVNRTAVCQGRSGRPNVQMTMQANDASWPQFGLPQARLECPLQGGKEPSERSIRQSVLNGHFHCCYRKLESLPGRRRSITESAVQGECLPNYRERGSPRAFDRGRRFSDYDRRPHALPFRIPISFDIGGNHAMRVPRVDHRRDARLLPWEILCARATGSRFG